jgi:ABC-2 type transport system permease protein
MAGIYPIFYESLDSVLKILQGFPPEFAVVFGFNISNLFSYNGFFSFTFVYLSLVGAIMAIFLAVSTFGREKRSKCVDFLLTKPRKRGNIYAAKLLSNLTVLIMANIIFITAVIALYIGRNQDNSLVGRFILAASGLFFTQLVFLAAGILYATLAKKVRSVSGIAIAFGFVGFILSGLQSILKEKAIRFIAPLKYFDPTAVFSTGGYETKYVITAIVVVVACIVLSYLKFCKSDAYTV